MFYSILRSFLEQIREFNLMKKAVFFDRDGVINVDSAYVGRIEQFNLLPGVVEALKQLRDKGYFLVLVTNQSGVARGMFTEADVMRVNVFMQENLRLYDAFFDAIYYCPHHPQAQVEKYRVECNCRKPKPGMIERAAMEHDIDLSLSVLIGDHASDLKAGQAAGVGKLVLVGNHIESEQKILKPSAVFKDLKAAADSM